MRMSIWRPLFLAVVLLFPQWHSYKFSDLPYADLVAKSNQLIGPFAKVQLASSLYDSSFSIKDGDKECSPVIIRIGKEGSSSPQVLISGEIHGDERVGPLSSLLVAQLLVWSAECRIRKSASHCLLLSENFPGIEAAEKDWLAFLAVSRETIIAPALNCIGYMQNRRSENGVDPNRDFSYSRKDSRCFQSLTARTLDRLIATNKILMVLTFHAGMEAIAYEWGSRNHPTPHDRSPDHKAHSSIANLLRDAAGAFPSVPLYPVGTMNSLVYPVDGGMEDWLYAIGWDNTSQHDCTSYRQSTVDSRTLVFLIETSNQKQPPQSLLGASENILRMNNPTIGHVGRNVRLSLMGIDLAMPYICWKFPSGDLPGALTFNWYVGGAVNVSASFITIQPHNRTQYLSDADLERLLSAANKTSSSDIMISPLLQGGSRWSRLSSSESMVGVSDFFEFAAYLPVGEYTVHAWAMVDTDWEEPNQGFPAGKPQSRFIETRTAKQSKYWSSTPFEVIISETTRLGRGVVNCANWHVHENFSGGTRHPASTHPILRGGGKRSDPVNNSAPRPAVMKWDTYSVEWWHAALFVGVFVLSICLSCLDRARRNRIYSSVSSNRYLNLPTGFQRL